MDHGLTNQNGLDMNSQQDNDLAIIRQSPVFTSKKKEPVSPLTRLEIKAARESQRTLGLQTCRERITSLSQGSDLKEECFKELFADEVG